jgi:hypothetical protein
MISNAARLAHRDSGILGEQQPAFSAMDATVGENLVFCEDFCLRSLSNSSSNSKIANHLWTLGLPIEPTHCMVKNRVRVRRRGQVRLAAAMPRGAPSNPLNGNRHR